MEYEGLSIVRELISPFLSSRVKSSDPVIARLPEASTPSGGRLVRVTVSVKAMWRESVCWKSGAVEVAWTLNRLTLVGVDWPVVLKPRPRVTSEWPGGVLTVEAAGVGVLR